MELVLHPPRTVRHRYRRLRVVVVAAVVLVGWLGAVLVLPVLLGWQAAVVTEDRGEYAAGTLVVTRAVPSSHVANNDVVEFAGGIRRVSVVRPGLLKVEGSSDVVTGDTPILERVVLTLPGVGMPLMGADRVVRWLAVGGAAAILASAAVAHNGAGRYRLAG